MATKYIQELATKIQDLRVTPNKSAELEGKIDGLVATLCRQVLVQNSSQNENVTK